MLHKKQGVRICTVWWRRRESNPRPNIHSQQPLRAQTVILGVLLSLFPAPKASRHALGLGELHHSWYGQSLPYARAPLSDARFRLVVLPDRTAALIKQRKRNYCCSLIYKECPFYGGQAPPPAITASASPSKPVRPRS